MMPIVCLCRLTLGTLRILLKNTPLRWNIVFGSLSATVAAQFKQGVLPSILSEVYVLPQQSGAFFESYVTGTEE